MDFAVLPPEVNSARMYAGPGSGPMLAAAAAWDGLAAELHSAASSYQSVIAGLTAGPWVGPSAAAMAAAAAQYVTWTRVTAARAEQAANKAAAAAAAYETAFAETVPPPVIAANRSLLLTLIATNLFGQNTPAIAATEAQYAEMWAQDASAMYGYAGSSASATALTPFTSPQPNTDTSGLSSQADTASGASEPSGGNVRRNISRAAPSFTAVPSALTSLANPAAGIASLTPMEWLNLLADLSGLLVDPELGAVGLGIDSFLGITALPYDIDGYLIGVHTDDVVSASAGIQAWPGTAPVPPVSFPAMANLGTPAVSASFGEANLMGALSVPPTWAVETAAIRPLAVALPATSLGTVEVSAGGAGSLFSQMALAGMAGRAMVGTGGVGRRERFAVAATTRGEASAPTASTHSSIMSPPSNLAGGPITSIAAELRELAALRDAGILTEDEFTEQKQRLLP
ncbi:PPE domain-containing protein [Mycobacterium simiae]|uniref:PPE domain-containing protein n=1 Tax=Mycobacterium simiae TaxID=1784 RepID=A0A5B1BI59_MYCSI|nr:PPE domain-containing protein [Mycobacterium simiae]KAA1248328.1 PPE domain-containing protein [Mycobacterium simiae]